MTHDATLSSSIQAQHSTCQRFVQSRLFIHILHTLPAPETPYCRPLQGANAADPWLYILVSLKQHALLHDARQCISVAVHSN